MTMTLSELIPGMTETKNDWFSYLKLRGNWAMVGKDAPAYLFDRRFGQYPTLPDGGYSYNPSFSTGFNLIPEMSSSWEVGVDVRFFAGRTRLDVAYYSIQTNNQIVTVRVPYTSGYVLQTRNEGSVKNHGVEISLEQDIIKNSDWTWTAAFNLGLNRGVVVDLPDDVDFIQGQFLLHRCQNMNTNRQHIPNYSAYKCSAFAFLHPKTSQRSCLCMFLRTEGACWNKGLQKRE